MRRFLICLLFSLGICCSLPAQKLISSLELEDFEFEDELYPFSDFDREGSTAYLDFEPVSLLEPGSFLQLWRKERKSGQKHYLTRYNLLLEEAWTAEMELDWSENILYLHHNEDEAVVITYEYDIMANAHIIRARGFDIDSGEASQQRLLWQYMGRSDQETFLSLSPDKQRIGFYHYERQKESRRVGIYYDYIRRDHKIGAKVFKPGKLVYQTFDQNLDLLQRAEFELPESKMTWLDAQIDNQGNFFMLGLLKPTLLNAFCYDISSQTLSTLTYENFVDRQKLNEVYYTHFPPTISQYGKRLYIAFAERQSRGKLKGTQAFQLINFDFEKGEVDLRRRIEINSSLLVTLEKQREDFGVPPLRRFDGFMIQEIIEMPDQSLWLMTQKFEALQYASVQAEFGPMAAQEHLIGEMVLYEFSPEGETRKALIVPSYQRSQSRLDKVGEFYTYHLDRETGTLSVLTREPSGDKLRGPERLYTRMVNLEEAEVSTRKLLYEGERRVQYFLRPYTVWHNNFLVSFVTTEGENGEAWLVSVNLLGAPEEEEEESRPRARARN
ncbi:MAG: hypothetical protein AAFQ68_10155 [Bacteroidota bacterium]